MTSSFDPLLGLAAQIVSAHVEHNEIPTQALPALIRDVYRTIASLEGRHTGPSHGPVASHAAPTAAAASRQPASSRTVFDDHLVCMDCGIHMKMLKRHLQTVHNASPEQYRAKWGLPGDYPMVAPAYASLRSSLAKESGLGKRPIQRGR